MKCTGTGCKTGIDGIMQGSWRPNGEIRECVSFFSWGEMGLRAVLHVNQDICNFTWIFFQVLEYKPGKDLHNL